MKPAKPKSNVLDLYKLGVKYCRESSEFLFKHGETVARIENMHHACMDRAKYKGAV